MALVAGIGGAALYGLHRAALFAEERGFIYYRKGSGSSGTVGNALLEMQAMLEPSKRHVLEQRLDQSKEEEDSGDPPVAGADGSHDERDANPLQIS